jgi:glycosyltransferase involved in cell wall biosynthesis
MMLFSKVNTVRVLHVVPYFADEFGGPPVMARQLCKHLASLGLEIDLVSTNDKLPNATLDWQITDGYRTKLFGCSQLVGYQFSPSFLLWFLRNARSYDLIHIHTIFCFPPAVAAYLCMRKGIPYFFTLHGTIQAWALQYKKNKKRVFLSLIGAKLLNKATAIHCLADQTRAYLRVMGIESKLFVLPNGLENTQSPYDETLTTPDEFQFLAGKRVVLFMGRLDPKKGIDRLLKGFADYRKQASDAHLVIAGPDLIGFKAKIENWIAELDIAESVTFTGMVEGARKQALFKLASAFVLLSRSEECSIALLEAMACGIPCIYSPECWSKAHEYHAGIELQEPYEETLVRELQNLDSNEESRRRLSMNARHYVRVHHDWQAISKELGKHYTQKLAR